MNSKVLGSANMSYYVNIFLYLILTSDLILNLTSDVYTTI